jgi:glycosyltransferase involved in cell wall biosynthesis
MKSPLVTVLMPAYNAANFIHQSIGSILHQSFLDFELLVIDDGSSDGTSDIVSSIRDSRIRLIRHSENKGLVATLNEGLISASSPLIARMDADDVSVRCRLALQVDFLNARDDLDAIGSAALIIGPGGVPRGVMRVPSSIPWLKWDLCFRNPVPHCSVMMRRERILHDYGGYPASRKSEDYALWSKIAARNRLGMMSKILVKYRVHDGSIMRRDANGDHDIHLIRRENISRFLGPVILPREEELLARSWENPMSIDWNEYCRVFENAVSSYLGLHGKPGQEVALEYQTLLMSSGQPLTSLLSALSRLAPRRLLGLPWLRLLATRLFFNQ